MAKNHGGINANDFANLIFKQMKAAKEGAEPYAEEAGKQVGESFADGIEQGFDDAANRISASSLKINKAFKDLAKKITNQKDIFNISLGGKNVVLDIDFSDIDINSDDFKKRISEVFEKFKIDNAIEFDSKAVEKQFKDMLGLHVKYTDKLSKLQNQSTKLTKPESIKTNVQEQLAIIDGLKEIQKVLDQTSGTSISLPHVYSSSTKDLRTIIETLDRVQKGEEKVGKQHDTNVEKIKKENKELKERNKILEEQVGPIEEGEVPPTRNPRAKKPKQPIDVEVKTIEETSAIKSKSDEQAVIMEQTQLDLTKEELKVEKEITAEKEKQIPQGASGTQQEIKSQEELQKEIEYTNRVIKNQKEWLKYLDPVLDDERFKTSGKREATEQLKSKTNRLVDVRRHPEQYAHLSDYETKAELAQSQAYKEAERQGVAQSTLSRYYTDAVFVHDQNIKKLQEARALHEKILADAEKEFEVLQQQLQVEAQKVKVEAKTPEAYETDSGQMSMLPAVEKEIEVKDKLVESNDKIAKSQKKVKEASQGTQMTIDDIVPKVEEEVDVLNKVGEAAEKAAQKKEKLDEANKKTSESTKKNAKSISEEAKYNAENMNFSTKNPKKLYEEMEAFAEQRRKNEGFTKSKVSVSTNALEEPIGATISYYNKATNESIVETFKLAGDETDRLILKTRQVTKGIEDFNKANLKAIKNQNNLMSQKNKTLSTLSGVLDPNANRTLAGTKYEEEARKKIQAIRDEVAKLDHETNGILSEEDFVAIKRRIDKLTQEARDFVNQSKNAEYAPTQLESHSVSSGNNARKYELDAKINEWKSKGIYEGDLKGKAEELDALVGNVATHEDLKMYLEGMREARALAKLMIQDKKQETEVAKEELAKQKADREAYINWWKTTLDAQDEADAYEKSLLERERKEKEAEERIIAARKKKEAEYEAWWQKALYDKERAPNLKYGKTTANSAQRKLEAMEGSVDALGVTNPEVLAKMDAYKAKVNEVLKIRARFESNPHAAEDATLVRQFNKAAQEAENVRRGIKAIIDEEQKMAQMSEEQGFNPVSLIADQMTNLETEMRELASANAQGKVEIKGWNDEYTKMYYTVTNSKGAVEEMTVALGQGTNSLYKYRTATKETGTLVQQIFKGIKTKAKELLSFVIGGGSVYKVIELLRQGIQYVREIDLALTELKKVTDETEESYDKFLETAAKTADKVGSTIQKVVSSTADWARLGYSMEQAAKFAESTQILMNVSEFTDVSQATDTLISSVQAFGYTAETSMEVVDLLNTIGKQYCRGYIVIYNQADNYNGQKLGIVQTVERLCYKQYKMIKKGGENMACVQCNRMDDTYRGLCKVCDYKKRNHEKVRDFLENHLEWTECEFDIILDHILYQKIDVVNPLEDILQDKTLSQIVNLIKTLHIGGRTPIKIELSCFTCGEKLVRPIGHFYKERIYCSLECRDKYKTKFLSGKNSPWYKRVNTVCTNCGKEIEVIPFEYNLCNEYGESNNFCSRECYCEYRSKYYVGEKHPMFGRPVSEQNKQRIREQNVRLISEGKMPQTMTKPHTTIYNLLVENKIRCENEHPLKYHSIDIYLKDYNLMIEIMGDYWHGIPLKYQYNQLNKQQLKSVKQDKSKHTYTKKYYDIEILYLWERDINNHIDLCWNLIQQYINNCGVLDDYNSYNYDFSDDCLALKENIIQPYFITQNPDRLQEVNSNINLEVVYPTPIMEGYNIQSALTI